MQESSVIKAKPAITATEESQGLSGGSLVEFQSDTKWLDDCLAGLKARQFLAVDRAMARLFAKLCEIRSKLPENDWKHFIDTTLLVHPARQAIHREPLTKRSFEKPRGYSGDAGVIDFIYKRSPSHIPFDVYHIHEFMTNMPAARAVRFRRQFIAEVIDQISERIPEARVLSIACGHCRELDLSVASRLHKLGGFKGIDHDAESLRIVEEDYGPHGATIQHGSVRQLVAGKLDPGRHHLVYALGLFDYLSKPIAKRLCERVFDCVLPGGEMIFANFMPQIPDAGYMESFMGWELIFRTPPEAMELLEGISSAQVDSIKICFDPSENIVLLRVRKPSL